MGVNLKQRSEKLDNLAEGKKSDIGSENQTSEELEAHADEGKSDAGSTNNDKVSGSSSKGENSKVLRSTCPTIVQVGTVNVCFHKINDVIHCMAYTILCK